MVLGNITTAPNTQINFLSSPVRCSLSPFCAHRFKTFTHKQIPKSARMLYSIIILYSIKFINCCLILRYKIPSKRSMITSLEATSKEIRSKISKDTRSAPISLTHDGWTSNMTQSYDTVTCHVVTDKWELKSAVLQTKKVEGKHTGENIAANLQATMTDWKFFAPNCHHHIQCSKRTEGHKNVGYNQIWLFWASY